MIEATLDTREFNRALKDYIAKTGKALAEVFNKKMFFVLRDAFNFTPKVDRDVLEKELGFATLSWVGRKGGTNDKLIYKPAKLVYKLVNTKRKKEGLPGVSGSEMGTESKKFIRRRIQGIGILKAGWSAALRVYQRSAYENAFLEKVPKAKGRSLAVPAKASDNWDAVAQTLYKLKAGTQGVHPHVVEAAQKAFDNQAKDMDRYLTEKLQKVANDHSGR